MLHKLNQKVVTVTDGSQVLEKYQKAIQKQVPFDLVIMDLTIPGGMGGKETVNKLYKIDPNVKAIVSSGYSTDPIMANFRDFKFKGVLKKPYTINQVKRIISNLL
jgi:CheY-like chemotaxis protein